MSKKKHSRERESMGCATSTNAVVGRKNKKRIIQESVVFVLQFRVPVQSDLQRQLKGVAPKTTIDRLSCLRNQIELVAEDTGIERLDHLLPFFLRLKTRGFHLFKCRGFCHL